MSLNRLRPPKGAKHPRKRVDHTAGKGDGKRATLGGQGAHRDGAEAGCPAADAGCA